MSIVLEGFPFIILGSFISSLIQVFVSEETILKIIPKNKFVGVISASLVGLIFPVCECAIIPITKRLIKKGVPLNMAITFMLSVPIVNPVVLVSTYYAFLGKPQMVLLRAIFGLSGAIIIGFLISIVYTKNPLKEVHRPMIDEACCDHHHGHTHDNCSGHKHDHCSHSHGDKHEKESYQSKAVEIVSHTSMEVYDVGKFFLTGAILASAMQTFIPKAFIFSLGRGNLTSIIIMMVLAFTLSICSETDAFIARTFMGQFTTGSLIAFMIFGPMIDIKNTLMLYGNFKLKFTIWLVFFIIAVCFILSAFSGFAAVGLGVV